MYSGAIVAGIDVAQIAIWTFWLLFAALVFYLHREDKREGYPLESDRMGGRTLAEGFPAMPAPKTFNLRSGGTWTVPRPGDDSDSLAATPVSGYPGAPLEPVGNPLLAGVGPGSWTRRSDEPDLTLDGRLRMVPMSSAPDYHVERADPDPVGVTVYGADGEAAGTVVDLWVDRSDLMIRYLEVEVASNGRRVLLPITCTLIDKRRVRVDAILASQFADVPGTRVAGQVTLQEEDRIAGYYGAGFLYATPSRMEPIV